MKTQLKYLAALAAVGSTCWLGCRREAETRTVAEAPPSTPNWLEKFNRHYIQNPTNPPLGWSIAVSDGVYALKEGDFVHAHDYSVKSTNRQDVVDWSWQYFMWKSWDDRLPKKQEKKWEVEK